MNYYVVSFSITSIISLILSLFVLSKNIKNELNISFGVFCLSVALWSFFYVLFALANNDVQALLWDRCLMSGAIVIPAAFTHFVVIQLELDKVFRPWVIFNYLI